MKKIFTFFLALVASVGTMQADIFNGTCGDNLTWSLDTQDSILTIEGSGEMTSNPWSDYKSYIKYASLPDGLTNIGQSAFNSCSVLTSVIIPNSVTSIGNNAFEGCSSLTSVMIPNSVTSIGNYAFVGCPSLTSVVVEKGNSVYDSRNNCNAIIETATNTLIAGCQNTIIPNSVTSIGNYAFIYCSSLTSITIPNSVTSIGEYAFYWCPSLTSVTIGNSVTSIGDYAFYLCSGLTSIYNYSPAPQVIDNEVFGEGEFEQDGVKYGSVDKSLCKLYVPQESINFYKVALIWRDFKNILPIESSDQAIDQIDSSSLQGGDRGRLILRDGQVLIQRGEKVYTLQGTEVK